jgi:hypothetical protein
VPAGHVQFGGLPSIPGGHRLTSGGSSQYEPYWLGWLKRRWPGGHSGGGAVLTGMQVRALAEYCMPGGQVQFGGLPIIPGAHAGGGGGGGAALNGTQVPALVEYWVPGGQVQFGGLPIIPGAHAGGGGGGGAALNGTQVPALVEYWVPGGHAQ